jgi:multiple sugar transport system substrate-binding protein
MSNGFGMMHRQEWARKKRAARYLWGAMFLLAALGASGCARGPVAPGAQAKPFAGVALSVAAVGDPDVLKTVAARRGEWEQTRGGEVAIAERAIDPKDAARADVLVFPGESLGALIDAGLLAALPEAVVRPPAPSEEPGYEKGASSEAPPDPLGFSDVVPAYRDQVTKYGDERMGLPYGGTGLVVVYRKDALSREENREEAEKAGVPLEPPKTWEALDALAAFFQGPDWDGDGAADSGIALALGPDAEGVGLAAYLSRAAALGQHRDQYSFLFDSDAMDPRIESPPFVEALEKLAALKASGPEGVEGFGAEAAREAFRAGKVAILIDRAELSARWGEPKGQAKVGVMGLPGSERVYNPDRKEWEASSPPNRPSYLPRGGGWLVAVTAKSPRREAAIDFLKYLVHPETAALVRVDRSFPMLPVRGSLLGQGPADPRAAPGVDGREWSRAVNQTLMAPRVVVGLRIPGAEDYLADLEKARLAAVGGGPAAEALHAAAEAWRARTRSLGVERQLWHYRRSLNSLATSPGPPAR